MNRTTRIAIVGAGLGGLTLAGLLTRAGFSVSVYEQTASFSRIGAGIILSMNATRILRRLDLEDDLVRGGILPDAFVCRDWQSGATIYESPFGDASLARHGGLFVNIHRAELHRILRLPLGSDIVRPDHRLRGIDTRGAVARLVFENGTMADVDIVIGADGIGSKVREALLGPAPPRFVGKIAPRAIFPAARLAGVSIRDCTKWWGPDRHVLVYYMSHLRDEVYVMAAVPAATWEGGDGPEPGDRDAFVAAFEGWHPDLTRVVAAADSVNVWPIYDRPRDDRWFGGPIVLMGDACHPMRPFMAAGGAMAIEDAAILSRCIADVDEPQAAFTAYAAARIPRVGRVQQISIDNSWLRGPTDTDWFYDYDAFAVDLEAASA